MSRHVGVLAITGTLAYAFAVAVHVLVHAAGSDLPALLTLPHAVESAIALAGLAAAPFWLGAGAGRAERRRRLALIRAALRAGTRGYLAAALGAVVAIAASLFLAEGASLDLDRMIVALCCSAVALLLTALCLRAAGRRLAAIVEYFARTIPQNVAGRHAGVPHALPRAHQSDHLLRRLHFRGPPTLLARP